MAQTIAERASFIENLVGQLELAASTRFSRWTTHRDACAVCSKDVTCIGGGPLRCDVGEALHATYSAAERDYARKLVEVTA